MVVGELIQDEQGQDSLRYRSLNSCLTFVSSLHGKQLISVEGLKHQGQLHSVQQAMADCHGSQCGFCTPGFVMSLFALQKNSQGHDLHQAQEALAGNLCRCTGYRPILDAAEQSCRQPCRDQFDAQQAQTISRLKAITPTQTGELNSGDKRCLVPLTVADLADLYSSHPEARLLAGGTDLALEVTQFHKTLPVMIYVATSPSSSASKRLPPTWKSVQPPRSPTATARSTRNTPISATCCTASLRCRSATRAPSAATSATPRRSATHPPADRPGCSDRPAPGRAQRSMALEDYFIDYRITARQDSEFIEKIIVPRASNDWAFRAYKVSKRLDDDISAVCGAFNLSIEDGVVSGVRIAFGGMAAIPKRARACEAALRGKPWNQASIERACQALAEDFSPLSDFRASKEYRLLTAQNLLRKYFIELQTPYIETRVTDYV